MTEPQVTLDVGGKFLNFLIDTGATYSVLIQHSGPTSLSKLQVVGIEGETKTCRQTMPLTSKLKSQLVTHAFLLLPSCPTPSLG